MVVKTLLACPLLCINRYMYTFKVSKFPPNKRLVKTYSPKALVNVNNIEIKIPTRIFGTMTFKNASTVRSPKMERSQYLRHIL